MTGNRILTIKDGTRTTSTFDAANQLQVELTGADRTTYTFDNNGNEILVLQPDGSRITTLWDYENNSVVIATPANGLQTSVYDPDNLRVKKEDVDGTKHFVYDGQAYLLETDASNITVAVYTQEPTTYGYLASQYRFDGSLWKPSYFHQDALGSTMQLTHDNEDVTDTFLYDAWGEVLNRTGTTENPFQWIGAWGYYKDETTGLYYVRRRNLRPSTGRWTSPDPLLFTDGPNLYVAYFVPNLADPSGMDHQSGACNEFEKWYRAEAVRGLKWTNELPNCPCKLEKCPTYIGDGTKFIFFYNPDPSIWSNPAGPWFGSKYHPGAYVEIRSRPASSGSGEQCTYDKSGNLITHGPAAGSADLFNPSNLGSHRSNWTAPVFCFGG